MSGTVAGRRARYRSTIVWKGEFRALRVPPVYLTAVLLILATAAAGAQKWWGGAEFGFQHPTVGALVEPASALRAAAWQSSTFGGLLLATVIVTIGGAQLIESGTWGVLRLYEHRSHVLHGRRLCAAVVFLALVQLANGLTLWIVMRVMAALRPTPTRPPTAFDTGTSALGVLDAGSAGWGEALTATAGALLVQTLYLSLGWCAAALLRNSIGALALGIGPWIVTAPLLLLPIGPYVPHAWIATLMSLPGEAQYRLYFWVQATGDGSPTVRAALVVGCAAAAAFLAQLLLRSERVLRPID
ncbi:ABC transporter permease [Streptomyces sp. NRRL S-237]|uniref:ABC transporter permease n=1 Tax=Streptomyces sp. NRRL S-237 TaxID=1463895 RepID=UPI0004CC482A|nr:ABC transporter permease [Streptomyces sp. NRRL S-237]